MSARNRALRAGNPTIKEIAARLGVSHSTVSRALNNHLYTSRKTKESVHAMAKELGYIANTAARVMRHARSSMVGLIIPDVENDFCAAVAKVTVEQCAQENLQLVLAVTEDDADLEYRHVRSLREALAAGVVITPSASCQRTTLDLLRGMVNVQLLRAHPSLESDFVGLDETGGNFHRDEASHRAWPSQAGLYRRPQGIEHHGRALLGLLRGVDRGRPLD